ncbi:MAG: hypothetical protein V3T54_00330 [Acidobacteriota bacterium]
MGDLVNRLKRLTDDVLPKLRQPDHGIVLGEEIAKNRRLLDDAERLARKQGVLTLRQIDEMMGKEKPLPEKGGLDSPEGPKGSPSETAQEPAEKAEDPYIDYLSDRSSMGAQEAIAKIVLESEGELTELQKNQIYRMAGDMDQIVEKIRDDVAKILKRVSVWKQP